MVICTESLWDKGKMTERICKSHRLILILILTSKWWIYREWFLMVVIKTSLYPCHVTRCLIPWTARNCYFLRGEITRQDLMPLCTTVMMRLNIAWTLSCNRKISLIAQEAYYSNVMLTQFSGNHNPFLAATAKIWAWRNACRCWVSNLLSIITLHHRLFKPTSTLVLNIQY